MGENSWTFQTTISPHAIIKVTIGPREFTLTFLNPINHFTFVKRFVRILNSTNSGSLILIPITLILLLQIFPKCINLNSETVSYWFSFIRSFWIIFFVNKLILSCQILNFSEIHTFILGLKTNKIWFVNCIYINLIHFFIFYLKL